MAKEIPVENKFAIIGGGHIGCALAEGLICSGVRADLITVSNPTMLRSDKLRKLGVRVTRDNNDAVRSAQWIFLAVKPTIIPVVLEEIKQSAQDKVIVSLAAGVPTATLRTYVGGASLARIMPNMPIAISKGIIGFFAGNLSKKEWVELSKILSKLGSVVQVKSESQLDAITLISGCGPGIVAFLITALAESAKTFGLSTKEANLVAQQTFTGTLAYLVHNGVSAEELMRSVATKNGVTEAILADFVKRGLTKNFVHAIAVGSERLKKLKK
jgi:pyrroline-5-carboxylate reductase